MIAALLSLALLFGAYDGTCESVDSSPVSALIDAGLDLDEVALEPAVVSARPAVDRLVAAHHAAPPGPSRSLPRVFRPPRS